MTQSFPAFFKSVNRFDPRQWQMDLAQDDACVDRLIPVGTGLGKTLGIATAWAYHRLAKQRGDWPRRLAWCLPMRVLVEQTAEELNRLMHVASEQLGIDAPAVHVLMGGVETDDWHLELTKPAVLVGTQDMLLSRALNRGYAAGRGRWPIDFALLNQDCLWVFDEVQLQGVGAVTGSQLQSFRNDDEARSLRPSRTWWASATLRSRWLETVDSTRTIKRANENRIEVSEADRSLPVYLASKPLTVSKIEGKISDKATVTAFADLVIESHHEVRPAKQGRITLVVVNRVKDAKELDEALRKRDDLSGAELHLIHSRFRGSERAAWRASDGDGHPLLSRAACEDPTTNRIIVSTQVIEAGVDISASCLITENAPWASLVQRFGRAARYGDSAAVIVVDRGLSGKNALPYDEDELAASLEALASLSDVGLNSLEKSDMQSQTTPDLDKRLFRLPYTHLLLKRDLDELFDTSADLTGDDIDISRFIREGDDTNVRVCWYQRRDDEEPKKWRPHPKFQPTRLMLCPVGVGEAKEWLFASANRSRHNENCDQLPYVFGWSYEDNQWSVLRSSDQMRPGDTLLVDYRCGGYSNESGFLGDKLKIDKKYKGVPDPDDVSQPKAELSDAQWADQGQQLDPLSQSRSDNQYVSIAQHGIDVAAEIASLVSKFNLPDDIGSLLQITARWHDYGKSHPVFRGNIRPTDSPWADREDIAKAPSNVWQSPLSYLYNHPEANDWHVDHPHGRRIGFRHELASVLGLLEIVRRSDPSHDAVAGLNTLDTQSSDHTDAVDPALASELTKLSASQLNLVLYLIASHHGKVRCGLHLTPEDQDFKPPIRVREMNEGVEVEQTVVTQILTRAELPVRGVMTGDVLPAIKMPIGDGTKVSLPEIELDTEIAAMGWSDRYGESWTSRVLGVRESNNLFALAFLEALVRAADVRVSRSYSQPEASQG